MFRGPLSITFFLPMKFSMSCNSSRRGSGSRVVSTYSQMSGSHGLTARVRERDFDGLRRKIDGDFHIDRKRNKTVSQIEPQFMGRIALGMLKRSWHTSHAPLMKLAWSKTYIGSVSHKLLVRFTLIPLADISLQACSIIPTRSPRLLPKAIHARLVVLPRDPTLTDSFVVAVCDQGVTFVCSIAEL